MNYLCHRGLLAAFAISIVCSVGAADVSIDEGWLRATPPSQSITALYFTVTNHSERACVLSAVQTPSAERAELHRTLEEDGMMKMRRQESFSIPARGTLLLAPGAEHIMLYGVTEPLQPGMSTTVQVDLGECGEVLIDAEVRDATGREDSGHGQHHH